MLTESLGGNSKTALIVTASPCSYNDAETVSTLRFGQLARKVKNKPKVNQMFTNDELLKMLEKAEVVIKVKSNRIIVLEECITSNGLKLPADDVSAKSPVKPRPIKSD